MVIRAWWPLFGLLVLAGAGITGLFVEHPEPHNRSQPTIAPYQNSHSDEPAATHSSNQHGQKGEQERSWIEGLFDKPTDTLLVCFNGLLVLFTYFLYSATSGLFKETAELRRIAGEQRVDLSRSIAAAEQSATAAIDQVSLSKEALITTERAFVYCERIHAIWTADKGTDLVIKWTFQPVLKNSGKTPTKRAVNNISSWVGIDAGDIPPNFDFSNIDNASPTMIGPDATMHGRTLDLDIKTLQKIRIGEAHALGMDRL
jgi:hypothetical protein